MFERTRQGIVDVIGGSDPLANSTIEEFRAVVEPALKKSFPRIVVNLESVPLIDSEGLEALLDINDAAQERGGILLLAAPNALCRDILRITQVDQQINTFDDSTSAIRSFSQ